jgi:hypothetical protein
MRITNTGRHSKRITFQKPGEGLRFIAGMNENHGNYEAAAKLYREAGDKENAERCEKCALTLARNLNQAAK